jgi:GH25 family lysozyme M1 (1,4-beta-N-acetylmuramidase)
MSACAYINTNVGRLQAFRIKIGLEFNVKFGGEIFMLRDVIVVDISRYQQRLDLPELQIGGVKHVIIKAGGGVTVDPMYHNHAENCLSNDMPISIYYWADPTISPDIQVQILLEEAELYPISHIWVDIEQWWSAWPEWYKALQNKLAWQLVARFRPERLSDFYFSFMEKLSANAKNPVGIYTSYGFVTSYAPKMAEWLANYDIWVAHFSKSVPKGETMTWQRFMKLYTPDFSPLLPPGANPVRVVGHQFTGDRVRLPGMYSLATDEILSGADVSVFNAEWLEKIALLPGADTIETARI